MKSKRWAVHGSALFSGGLRLPRAAAALMAVALFSNGALAGDRPGPVERTGVEAFKAQGWNMDHRGTPLDLSRYVQTFSDDFRKLDVTADGGAGRWYAPVHATPPSVVQWIAPTPDGPFQLVPEGLRIRAEKRNGIWQSAVMQTVDGKGQGFAQQYGYFEMTAKFPPGPGTSPAFWLLSQNGFLDKSATRTEIDVVEWYGDDSKGHHSTVHLWPGRERPGDALDKPLYQSKYFNLKADLVNGRLEGFHSYGAEITPDWVIIYYDRKELQRYPTLPEFRTPLYMVIDLALFKKELDKAIDPTDLIVKNVSAYRLR